MNRDIDGFSAVWEIMDWIYSGNKVYNGKEEVNMYTAIGIWYVRYG
jgi:hypothetical protein